MNDHCEDMSFFLSNNSGLGIDLYLLPTINSLHKLTTCQEKMRKNLLCRKTRKTKPIVRSTKKQR